MNKPVRLPRGQEGAYAPSSQGTATWADHETVVRFPFEPGGFFLGAHAEIPDSEKATAQDLNALRIGLTNAHHIHPDWRTARINEATDHLNALRTHLRYIGIANDMHGATIAATRGGKGTTTIIPNLLTYTGSLIAIDPKGENAARTAQARAAMGQAVHVLDPYRQASVAEEHRAYFNPLDFIDTSGPAMYEQAASIANQIMVRSDGEAAHFDDTSRTLVKALILYAKLTRSGDEANLVTVYRLLAHGIAAEPDAEPVTDPNISPIQLLLERLIAFHDPAGVIAAAAALVLDMGPRERGSVLSTARRNLEFLELPSIAKTVSRSTFSLDLLKTAEAGASVYLCLPPQYMDTAHRWLRLMIGLTMERMYLLPTPARPPVLFLLEEFHILGNMPVIETAIAYAAGYGVKFHLILQDLSQLRRHYPKSWETFIGNMGYLQLFATTDLATLDYFSQRIGDIDIMRTVRTASTSQTTTTNDASAHERIQSLLANRGPLSMFVNPLTALSDHSKASQGVSSNVSSADSYATARLIAPSEIASVFARKNMACLVLIAGEPPMVLRRLNYYEAEPFVSKIGGEPPAREPDPAPAAQTFVAAVKKALASSNTGNRA